MKTDFALILHSFSAMTEDEITQVEKLVNESIAKAYDVDIKNMPIEEAKRQERRLCSEKNTVI